MPFADPKLDDRTVAILAGAYLEEYLRVAIITRGGRMPTKAANRAVFKSNGGALSTFANRIWLSEMMGIINEPMFKDLERIKWIRNEFAHSLEPKSFSDPEITAKCAEMVGSMAPMLGGELKGGPRFKFVDCALALSWELLGAVEDHVALWNFVSANRQALEAHRQQISENFARWMAEQEANQRGQPL